MKTSSTTPSYSEGLGPKKTIFVMVTVVGCIAILWPKVFHPMMFGSSPPTQPYRDFRPGGTVKCCEVILDKETFLNASAIPIGPQLYRKNYNYLIDDELSLRQERPPHLRPEGIHPAMLERGRAIPTTQTVPIVDRARNSRDPPPRIVEGRPGPIPGMRPPMGAGSVHQAQPKGGSMSIIMPLYTIGILAFFCYTIMKLVLKKPQPNEPYGSVAPDSTFKKQVFGENAGKYKGEGPKIGWKEQAAIVTAVESLIDEYDNTYGKESTSDHKDANETSSQNGNISNGHARKHNESSNKVENLKKDDDPSEKFISSEANRSSLDRKKREVASADKSVAVVGMELTASFEGGHKWNRPSTPEFPHHQHSSHHNINGEEPPKSIYLEGSLPHESQILVADSETKTEKITDLNEDDGDEPAVVLSSKISLSLISVSSGEEGVDDEIEDDDNDNDVNIADRENKEEQIHDDNEHFDDEPNNNEEVSDEN